MGRGAGRVLPKEGDLLFVADSHLRPGCAEVGRFVNFLTDIRSSASVLFILGDLFDTWVGIPDLQGPHHREVLEALRGLAGSGVRIHFVEGNRDFLIQSEYLGDPFTRVGTDHLLEEYGGRRFFAVHGDRVNRKDRQYRLWRTFTKNRVTQEMFRLLPAATRLRVVETLERSLKKTNQRHRIEFPMEECHRFARRIYQGGADVIIMGHFHEERVIRYPSPEGEKVLFVLPAWNVDGGYLRFRGTGEGEFIRATERFSVPGSETPPGAGESMDPDGRIRVGSRRTARPA